jgi:hypothetical protein
MAVWRIPARRVELEAEGAIVEGQVLRAGSGGRSEQGDRARE